MNRRIALIWLAGFETVGLPLGVLLWPAAASSQAVSAPTQARSSYSAIAFARFAPRNALEMLVQVPGFYQEEPDGTRGLAGSMSNILVDGQPLLGKPGDVALQLERIPAARVRSIEVLGDAGLVVDGVAGRVANIITRGRRISGQFAWQPEMSLRYDRSLLLHAGSASLSGTRGPVDYTLGVRNGSQRRDAPGLKIVSRSDGSLIDRRQERQSTREDKLTLSGSLKYRGHGNSTGNLNVSFAKLWSRTLETSDRSGPNLVDRNQFARDSENGYSWETGGDFEFGLKGGRLKLIGLGRSELRPRFSQVVTYFADSRFPVGSRFVRDGKEAENDARAEYFWKRGAGEWQLSAERAFNSLEVFGGFYELVSGGRFAQAPLPGGGGRVEEHRAEAAISLVRPIGPRLKLHTSIGAELSRLHEHVSHDPARKFLRPKGFVSLSWAATPRLDLEARLTRRVDQISFYDFFASKNLRGGDSTSGNLRLVPPLSWDVAIEAARDFGAYGSGTLRLDARRIDGVIDYLVVPPGRDARGNVGQALIRGMELTGTAKLDPFGWTGAKIDVAVRLQKSWLRDPITRSRRRISNEDASRLRLALRHDLPRSNWAWGADYVEHRRAPTVQLGSVNHNRESPGAAGLFIENKDVSGLKMRVSLMNLLGASDYGDRDFFTAGRGSPVARTEWSVRKRGPKLALSVSGAF